MCRGFRSVNIVLTLYFESLETLDFTVFYSYVNGSNPLTHGSVKKGLSNILLKKIPFGIVKMILPKRSEKYDRKNCYYENQLRIKRRYLLAL